MDKARQLMLWRDGLATAARSDDWPALARVDNAIANGLPEMLAAGGWGSAERDAFLRLQSTHSQVRGKVSTARAETALRLTEIREQREGWLAYALATVWEDKA